MRDIDELKPCRCTGTPPLLQPDELVVGEYDAFGRPYGILRMVCAACGGEIVYDRRYPEDL